jgi:acyl-CoA thioesterase II
MAHTSGNPYLCPMKDIIELLRLEQIEVNLFRGDSRDVGSDRVFGGQVLGQALSAAIQTIENEHVAHSLHAYFLLPGDMKIPILYQVERLRNGRSFSTRRVTAIQHGQVIFNLAASFQADQEGVSHQDTMPAVPGPEGLLSFGELRQQLLASAPVEIQRYLRAEFPVEVRPVEPTNPLQPEKRAPLGYYWFRVPQPLPDDPNLHKCILAYASDANLLGAAMRPHGLSFFDPRLKIASLDHAMWFHRPFRADEWLLYAVQSPNAAGARGLAWGHIYTQEGLLVASTAQEGMIRS